VAFAVIAYGLVATAVCVLLGPIFVPFFILPKLDWLFWGWFKAFVVLLSTKVVAAAFCFIFCQGALGIIWRYRSTFDLKCLRDLPALVVTLAVCVYGLAQDS